MQCSTISTAAFSCIYTHTYIYRSHIYIGVHTYSLSTYIHIMYVHTHTHIYIGVYMYIPIHYVTMYVCLFCDVMQCSAISTAVFSYVYVHTYPYRSVSFTYTLQQHCNTHIHCNNTASHYISFSYIYRRIRV